MIAERRDRGPVAVIGRGVIGLTSALRLAEAGHAVTLFHREDADRMASHAAGAYWWPHKADPPARVAAWARTSFEIYRQLASIEGSGVDLHLHERYCQVPDEHAYVMDFLAGVEAIPERENRAGHADAIRVRLPRMDVPVFMPFLEARARAAGVRFVAHSVESLDDLLADFELVVNCAGLGAAGLTGDRDLHPIRGQMLRLTRPPGLDRSIRVVRADGALTLVLPRGQDCVLGGTVEPLQDSLTSDPAVGDAIHRRCLEVAPELEACDWLGTIVGLRPGRSVVRLEREVRAGGGLVVHNYGHGGSGFTLAWGCAQEVVALAAS